MCVYASSPFEQWISAADGMKMMMLLMMMMVAMMKSLLKAFQMLLRGPFNGILKAFEGKLKSFRGPQRPLNGFLKAFKKPFKGLLEAF